MLMGRGPDDRKTRPKKQTTQEQQPHDLRRLSVVSDFAGEDGRLDQRFAQPGELGLRVAALHPGCD